MAPPGLDAMRPGRLGLNHGAYHGERITLGPVIEGIRKAAEKFDWRLETLPAGPGLELLAFTRSASTARQRVYISAGIHGDEPAGPLAVRQLLQEDQWPTGFSFWVCPCLNPTGCAAGTRENSRGADLNRDYRHLETAEVRAHMDWLSRQPGFDLTICLHEDWESHGFYLYELNPDQRLSLAEPMMEAVAPLCPIDLSEVIEGREAHAGIIRPSLDPNSRPQWPEAFHLIQHKTRLSYTLEAPSDFPLPTRQAALVAAVRRALDRLDRTTGQGTSAGS